MKRRLIFPLALLLILLACPAHAQSFVFNWDDPNVGTTGILLNDQGQPLTDPDEFPDIYAVESENGWFAVAAAPEFGAETTALKYGLIDAGGNLLTGLEYEMLEKAYADRILYMKWMPGDEDEADSMYLYGILDGTGAELTPPLYTNLVADGAGGFYGLLPGDVGAGELVRIDHDGAARNTGLCAVNYLYEVGDLIPVIDPATGLQGYVNSSVEWAIEPQFIEANNFSDGLAAVIRPDSGGMWGVIAEDGSQLLPCTYEWVYVDHAIIADLPDSTLCDVFDLSGNKLFTYDGTVSSSGSYFAAWPTDMDGMQLLDASGNVLRTVASEEGYFYSMLPFGGASDLLVFSDSSDGLSYLMGDPNTPISQGYYTIGPAEGVGDQPLLIASTADMVYNDEYEYWDVEWLSIRYGLIDAQGNVVMPMEYRSLSTIPGTSLLAFEDHEGYGVMDVNGNVLYYRSNYQDLMD